jgi:DNA-binding transcriptional LysR family regulator
MWHRPDPDLLQTFIAIVENGSFTSAAKRIHRTQTAVSMQMSRLEEMMECRFFARIGWVVKLTNEGEVFYDHARRILSFYGEALAAFESSSLKGEVSVGLPDDFSTSILPSILSRFSRLHPKVHFHIHCEPSRRLIGQVSDGSVDVALVTEGEGIA